MVEIDLQQIDGEVQAEIGRGRKFISDLDAGTGWSETYRKLKSGLDWNMAQILTHSVYTGDLGPRDPTDIGPGD